MNVETVCGGLCLASAAQPAEGHGHKATGQQPNGSGFRHLRMLRERAGGELGIACDSTRRTRCVTVARIARLRPVLGDVGIGVDIAIDSFEFEEGNRIEGGWVYRPGAGGRAKRAKQVQAGIASRYQEVGTGSLDGAIPAGDVERGGKSA